MGPLHSKVLSSLRAQFPDLVDGLETIESTGRVTGWVGSGRFDGLDDRERQSLLWSVLEKSLDQNELSRLGPIVALASVEMQLDVTLDK
jgi:hypothetical protein